MKILISFIFSLISVAIFAQTYTISGQIVEENNITVIGANVTLQTPQDSIFKAVATDTNGKYQLKNVPQGAYTLKVSYIGFQTFYQRVRVRGNINLGEIKLSVDKIKLAEIEIVEQTVAAVQNEDTTEFNSNAYKTNPDANAEDLIKKMPGVTVTNGKINAQGEEVKEVLVDGKPFFGNDPNAALKTLPAEVIQKIQIFDKESEQAQLTGVSDGQTSKTINIITKSNMRSGEFGKVYAGYGYENRYQAGGNINIFNGDQRISIIAQSNNVNNQNFSSDDLLGVLGSSGKGRRGGGRGRQSGGSTNDFLVNAQNGIITTQAFGINYTDEWGENLEVTGSYFFNLSNNNAKQKLTRSFLDDDIDFNQIYTEKDSSYSRNINHRLSFRMDYKFDEFKTLTIEPRLSIQQNEGSQSIFGQNIASSDLLNSTNYDFSSDLAALNFTGRVSYRQRFEKRGRSFSVSLNSGYNESDGNSNLYSENSYFTRPELSDTLDQFSNLENDSWNISARAMYTEPLTRKSILYLDYNASLKRTNANTKTYDFDKTINNYNDLNTSLSNEFVSDYFTQRAGLGMRYGERRSGLSAVAGVGFQWSELTNKLIYPFEDNTNRSFFNLIPFAMAKYRFSKTENLRFYYRANTNPPSITQLQKVINNSNPLQLTTGNPDLEQAVQHQLSFRYNKTNTAKSSIFYAAFNTEFHQNHIANNTFIANRDTMITSEITLGRGGQLIQPINLAGYFKTSTFLTYGFPVKAIKSNLNFNFSGIYVSAPGLVNDIENQSNTATAGIGVTLSSNISEKVDFTLTSTSNINNSTNTADGFVNTQYFNQVTSGTLNLIFGNNWVFKTEVAHNYYDGLTDGFNQNYVLWNMSLGKKFLKNERGDLRLTVFDLLNQNTSISRNITNAYIEDIETIVLQRYLMLTFTYDIRHFGKAPEKKEREGRRRGGF